MSRGCHSLLLFVALVIGANVCRADESKKSSYPFTAPPAKALENLGRLGKTTVTPDEESLFSEARHGKLAKWSFDEAVLLASGVTEAAKRKEYLAQIDDLEAKARGATGTAQTPREKGEQLLHFLHDGPMAKGYEADQTLLHTLLDTGKYNCVSSAVLYNLLARRLGLEARAVEVPGHVYSVVYLDGKPIDVETTNTHGFDPGNPEQQEKLRKEKGIEVSATEHREQREVRELGLTAIVYSNRCAALSEAKHFHEAAIAGFCALSLDPESPAAAANALAALTNWGRALSKEGNYEEAVRVASTGLQLGPKDQFTLRNNRNLYWHEWAGALSKDGKEDEALALLRRAIGEAREEDRNEVVAMQADLYVRPGEASIESGEWETALSLMEHGLKKVDKEAAKTLRGQRNGVYLRWSDAENEKAHFEKAVGILERALAVDPEERDFPDSLRFLIRDEAKKRFDAGKGDEAKKTLLEMRKRFAKCKDVPRAGTGFVNLIMDEPLKQLKYNEALDLLDQYAEVVEDSKALADLAGRVYDEEAHSFIDKEAWAKAAAVYEKGLKRYPGNGHVKYNLEVCQERARK